MRGGGTPALGPIKTPGLVCGFTNASIADAGDQESARTPAAANRALPIDFMCPPMSSYCTQNCLSLIEDQFKRVIRHPGLILFRRCVANLHASQPAALDYKYHLSY